MQCFVTWVVSWSFFIFVTIWEYEYCLIMLLLNITYVNLYFIFCWKRTYSLPYPGILMSCITPAYFSAETMPCVSIYIDRQLYVKYFYRDGLKQLFITFSKERFFCSSTKFHFFNTSRLKTVEKFCILILLANWLR